jgi:hypothetical protein
MRALPTATTLRPGLKATIIRALRQGTSRVRVEPATVPFCARHAAGGG